MRKCSRACTLGSMHNHLHMSWHSGLHCLATWQMANRGAPIIAVYGHVEHTGVLREDLLCSVAKVHVPVQDDHPACASLLGCSGCHSCRMQGSAHQRDNLAGSDMDSPTCQKDSCHAGVHMPAAHCTETRRRFTLCRLPPNQSCKPQAATDNAGGQVCNG